MRKLSLLLSGLLLVLTAACGGGGGGTPPAPVPAPVITSFSAAKATLTTGDSTTLTAVFANGTGSVSGGVGAVTSGTTVTVTPGTTTTYTLTVTNSASQSLTQTTTVTVVPVPITPVILAPLNVTASQAGYTASTPAQAGTTYAWTMTNGTITAGDGTSSLIFTAGASGTVGFSCVATNAAGTASIARTAASTVVSAPSTPVITAPASVAAGATSLTASVPDQQSGSTYAWTLTGGAIAGGASTSQILFSAGASGSVNLGCVVTNPAGTPSAPGTASTTIVAIPTRPVITAPASVTANQGGYTASTPGGTGLTFAWTLTGGTLTAGAGTNSITFTAGPAGTVGFSCVATNALGVASGTGITSSTIVAEPTAPVLQVPVNVTANQAGYPASTPAQPGVTFAWTLTGGTLTAGAGTNRITFTPGASGTVVFSCVATNAVGTASAAGTASSTIVPGLTVPVITAPAAVTTSQPGYTASTPALTGLSYAWAITNGTITAGAATSSITFTPGASGTVGFSCVATNGASVSSSAGTATSTIVAAPSIAGFTAAPGSIVRGHGAVLSAAFAGGTGLITPGSLAIASGGTQNVTPTATTTYTLTVANAAGTATTATATVTVTPPPPIAIASFTATPASVDYGGSTTLTWALIGAPTAVKLDGADVFGATTAPATPVRRQAYTLQASDGVRIVGATVKVPARGLNLVAGLVGSASGGSQDGQGANARFSGPQGLARDAAGNLYVADTGNFTIRKLTPGGLSSTLAGSALVPGYTNGTGAAAAFGLPIGLAVDVSGTVYVADATNNAIRLITPVGVVSTFAGDANGLAGFTNGTGIAALFSNPTGVAVTSAGLVYVADSGNNVIRQITPAGVVSTFAGSTTGLPGSTDGTGSAARFNTPTGVALDAAGNLYVIDSGTGSPLIRKITPAGVVSTLAGGASTNGGSPDGTGSGANFGQPTALTVDDSGNVYVTDLALQIIREITPAGVVTTLAGIYDYSAGAGTTSGVLDGPNLAATFNNPSGVAVDASGNLYVADTGNNTLRRIAAAGGVSTWAGAAYAPGQNALFADGIGTNVGFNQPWGLAVDGAGTTYVADTSNNLIRKITPAGQVSTFAGGGGTGVATGHLDGTGSAATFSTPRGVAVDGAGTVYVADAHYCLIRRITPDGVVTTLAGGAGGSAGGFSDGTGAAAAFRHPCAVAVDTVGNTYVADTGNHTIRKVTPAGVVSILVAAPTPFPNPVGVAVDGAGTVYVADGGDNSIWKVSPAGVPTLLAGQSGLAGYADGPGAAALFDGPQHLTVDGTGNVYVADSNNSAIRKITPAGVVSTVAGSAPYLGTSAGASGINYTAFGPLPAAIGNPMGIALSPDGDLVVTTNNGVIQITAP